MQNIRKQIFSKGLRAWSLERGTYLIFICSVYLALILNGCSINIPTVSQEELQKLVIKVQSSKLIILDIYHNRCESCKKIEPIIEKLKTIYSSDENIVFLKYDLSNPFTIYSSRRLAKQLGLEGIYKPQRFSGVVLIIDTQKKLVLDTLTAEYNLNKYNEVIEERLKGQNAT